MTMLQPVVAKQPIYGLRRLQASFAHLPTQTSIQYGTLELSHILPDDLKAHRPCITRLLASPLSFPAPKTTPSVLVWGSLMQNAGPPSRTSPTKPPRQEKALELSPEPNCVEYESGQCCIRAKTRKPYRFAVDVQDIDWSTEWTAVCRCGAHRTFEGSCDEPRS